MIVLFGGEKGGSGKTTLATNVAAIRTIKIEDLLLVDTDRQSTASFWCGMREDNNVSPRVASIQKYDKTLRSEVKELQKKYKDIIIDAGGRDSPELRSALLVADIAIFPLRPSQFDLWTMSRLSALVESALDINEKLKSFVVINQASPNPAVKEVEEAREFISEFKHISLFSSIICERISYRRAAMEGKSVVEYKPEDTKAIEEISNLYNEIYP